MLQDSMIPFRYSSTLQKANDTCDNASPFLPRRKCMSTDYPASVYLDTSNLEYASRGAAAAEGPHQKDEEANGKCRIASLPCNLPGLNGLKGNGLQGLKTGCFTVEAWMPIRYNIEIIQGLFELSNTTLLRTVDSSNFPPCLSSHRTKPGAKRHRRLLVVDGNVLSLYGDMFNKYFEHYDIEISIHSIVPDEPNKNFVQVLSICTALQSFNVDRRNEPIIAIGGGVCLDIAGLAANLYRRNTPIIKIPTTLIGMVDAAVGVKTAVNLNGGKNKVGTYCPPLAVFVDTSFLHTLDERHVRNGGAEILKMACIKDEVLFLLLENFVKDVGTGETRGKGSSYAEAAGRPIIERSIQGMLEELEPNLWEFNLCRIVDYGHTFSPCLEMAALPTSHPLLHGEAVCIDMAFTTIISRHRGLLTEPECNRVIALMRNLGLAIYHPELTRTLCRKALDDVTAGRGGKQRTPLMSGIGRAVFVDDLTGEELDLALEELMTIASEC